MSTTEELTDMVMQLHVPDLKSLLRFAGCKRIYGAKLELRNRVLQLIHSHESVPFLQQLRCIYHARVSVNPANQWRRYEFLRSKFPHRYRWINYRGPNPYSARNAAEGIRILSSDCYGSMRSSTGSEMNDVYSSNDTITNNNNNNRSTIDVAASSSRTFEYTRYLQPNTVIPAAHQLSNVAFQGFSFYTFKSSVVALTPLVAQSQRAGLFRFAVPFVLTCRHEHALVNRAAKMSGGHASSRYQIQLRIGLLDGDGQPPQVVTDSLPPALAVELNDEECELPPAIPFTGHWKRVNAPVDLTPHTCRNHAPNKLVISWSAECDRLYACAVHLVEKRAADELITELVTKGERDPRITKTYLCEKLMSSGGSPYDDDDIAATSLKVSLRCPLGKSLMRLPVRATTCDHVHCFDGILYVKMNEARATWQCPVCSRPCLYEDLFVDGYFAGILRDRRFGGGVKEIRIDADGSVTPVVPAKRAGRESSPSPEGGDTPKKRARLEDVELVEHAEQSNLVGKAGDGRHGESSRVFDQPKKNVILVDLVETDSESEDCHPRNTPNISTQLLVPPVRPQACIVFDVEDSDHS